MTDQYKSRMLSSLSQPFDCYCPISGLNCINGIISVDTGALTLQKRPCILYCQEINTCSEKALNILNILDSL